MKETHTAVRILNVDDNEIGRYTKTRMLQRAGFEVIEAVNGADALRAVREQRPKLVLLDLRLPDVSGFEVCRRIKSDPATNRLPVLHITALADGDKTEMGSIESGADIFLAQPVEPQELITVVRTLLRLQRTEIGLAESEERMRLATEGAGIATWDIDLRDGSAYWNRQFYALLGYESNTGTATWDMWRHLIHAEDRDAVGTAMDNARRNGGLFSQEHRIVRFNDGAERWLAPFGKIHADEQGQATRFTGIVLDISARKRGEMWRDQVLRLEQRARSEAENVARLKDEFLATLSHELRSPMTAILGWLRLMRTGRLTSEQSTTAIETIERNALLQNKLINDLLDVSRVIAGKLDLVREPGLIEEVIKASGNSVLASAEAKQIQITMALEPIGPLQFDNARMQQVLANLLSNAIKFTPEGGQIDVTSRRDGDMYEIAIADNGEGVAAELLPHLFERFSQADGSTTRQHGGLGLGLAIVRHIVALHGGTVDAQSAGPGAGSTFRVRLPIDAEVVLAAKSAESLADTAKPATLAGDALKGLRILVTDDEETARGLMTHLLQTEGADVISAANASEAQAICSRWQPAVLVLDIGMPGEDGYSLLRRLRSNYCVNVPAIAVTGLAREEDQERALAAGFQAHVSKPYNVETVVGLIESLARRSQQDGIS